MVPWSVVAQVHTLQSDAVREFERSGGLDEVVKSHRPLRSPKARRAVCNEFGDRRPLATLVDFLADNL